MTEATNKPELFCSFCGKSQHEVRKLIAGPTVFICDECTALCTDIICPAERKDLRRWAIERAMMMGAVDPDSATTYAAKLEAYVSAQAGPEVSQPTFPRSPTPALGEGRA